MPNTVVITNGGTVTPPTLSDAVVAARAARQATETALPNPSAAAGSAQAFAEAAALDRAAVHEDLIAFKNIAYGTALIFG